MHATPGSPATTTAARAGSRGADGRRTAAELAAWVGASMVVAVVHNGLWATPNLEFFSLAARRFGQNPFTGQVRADYLLNDRSLLGLARLTGQTAPHAFARLHLVVLLVAWIVLVVLALRRFGPAVARNLTVLLAASPLVTVSMLWLGQPDPLTGACGIAMVLVRRLPTVFALGVLAGLTHPEQAVFMAATAAVVRTVLPPAPGDPPGTVFTEWWRLVPLSAAAAVGGVAVGRLLTEAWFRYSDIIVSTPRTEYLRLGWDGFLAHHRTEPVGLAWTLWGPLWLVVGGLVILAVLPRARPADRPATGLLWAALGLLAVAALVPTAVTLDQTRVYAVVTAPLLAGAAVGIGAFVVERTARIAAVALLAVTAVVPGGFATGSTTWRHDVATPDMVAFLADGSLPAGSGGLTPWLFAPLDVVIPTLPEP